MAFATDEPGFIRGSEAIREVESNWERHSRAARVIAEQHFDSDTILTRLVEEAMDGG